ncbi:MAG TPA: phage holin family protein [Dongiaceae bacterium]|nr:phage holin family protein [Dongiaceae bacterium]
MPARATDGIVRSARRMLAILVSMARTRLNLLAIEIMQEKSRLWLLLILTALAMLFAFMALLTLSLFVVVAFWDANRLLAIGCLFAFYVAAVVVTLVVLRQKSKIGSNLFAGTLGELAKDSAALQDDLETQDVDFDVEPRGGHG